MVVWRRKEVAKEQRPELRESMAWPVGRKLQACLHVGICRTVHKRRCIMTEKNPSRIS